MSSMDEWAPKGRLSGAVAGPSHWRNWQLHMRLLLIAIAHEHGYLKAACSVLCHFWSLSWSLLVRRLLAALSAFSYGVNGNSTWKRNVPNWRLWEHFGRLPRMVMMLLPASGEFWIEPPLVQFGYGVARRGGFQPMCLAGSWRLHRNLPEP